MKPTQDNLDSLVTRIINCIAEICHWMRHNFLKFNDDKLEVMLIGSAPQLKKVKLDGIPIGQVSVTPSPVVRNLGILQDNHMDMSKHIS